VDSNVTRDTKNAHKIGLRTISVGQFHLAKQAASQNFEKKLGYNPIFRGVGPIERFGPILSKATDIPKQAWNNFWRSSSEPSIGAYGLIHRY
jgi:hypothetical protein